MSDQVVGVALLMPETDDGEPGRLHFIGEDGAGKRFIDSVPIVSEGVYDQVKRSLSEAYQRDYQLWAYRIEGDTLHCRPSINMTGRGWHNSYNWSVKYRVYKPDDCTMRDLMKELNRTLFPSAI
jgi:hypothetical protein